jgi:flagellar motor component MotA
MNVQAIIGIVGFVGITVAAILMGSPLFTFFDVSATICCVGGTIFLLGAIHGFGTSAAAIGSGLRGLLWSNPEHQGTEAHEHNAHIASTGGILCMLMGGLGALIGLIQMLQNMNDPTTIGPAMAFALLSTFYAIVLNMLIFVPVGRFHREMARTPAG